METRRIECDGGSRGQGARRESHEDRWELKGHVGGMLENEACAGR